MARLVTAAIIVVVAVIVAEVVRRRRVPDAPTQKRFHVPQQLDRNDFPDPGAPWLVAVFTSETCDMCADVASKAAVLASREVAVANIEFASNRALHERYKIDAVPTLVIVDEQGVTRQSFLGPITATDLWAAVAEAREPGSLPESCSNHD